MKAKIKALSILLILASCSNTLVAQKLSRPELYYNLTEDGLAVKGYDLVSYFIDRPLKGSAKFSSEYNGVNYWFSTKENQQLFNKTPERFIPAYGGWCAYAMGKDGDKVKVDPKTYKVIDGKLYLFYNAYFNNTLLDWNKDERSLRLRADNNWELLVNKKE